jgi:hypothetical protein
MEQFGLGAESSSKFIYDMYAETSAMGLNAGKVIKKFESNLGLLNKLNFKAGVKGLKEMAKFSEKYKLDMNAVASVADKVFRPEGAIEAAAQLQVLGGDLAALGDPFQLMYKARNAPEELAKSLTKAASASAVFNEKTGEFEVNAYELDRMKEAANALGMDYQELVKTAKQGAKINMFEGLLSGKGLKDEDRDTIATLSQMVDGKAMIQVGMTKDGKADMRELSSLSSDQLQQVLKDKKNVEEAATQATGVKEKWENLLNEFIIALYPLLESLQKELRPTLEKLFDWGKDFALTLKGWMTSLSVFAPLLKWGLIIGAIGKVLSPFLSLGMWLIKGRMLANGFNSGVAKGPLGSGGKIMSTLTGGGKGAAGAAAGSMGGGGTPTPGTTQGGPGGISKGLNPMDMIKGATAILILSAALFVFAKALQEFDKLKNGWETLAMAGVSMVGLTIGLWAISKIPTQNLIEGAIALALMGAAFIPFAYGLSLLQGLSWEVLGMAGVALIGLTAAVFGLGALMMTGVGAVLFGAGILGFIALGAAMVVLGFGLSMVLDPLSKFMTVIGDGTALLNAGLGFLSLSAGIGILTFSLIALGAASLLALPGLLMLGGVTSMLTETASALQSTGGAEGITKSINAINSVDENKLEALKDLSMWMALVGASPTIKFDESLTIDGSIQLTGQSGGKTNTDWIKDPIFVSHLKEMIADATKSDERGGKA